MPTQDTTRRLSPQIVNRDIDALHGLQTVSQYDTIRPEASLGALQLAYQNMLAQQQVETERQLLSKAAADAARLAEWDFHKAVLSMKEAVVGQFGSDSDAAQAVGLKKKSERKRPTRQRVLAQVT
jgi:hypothetical protein